MCSMHGYAWHTLNTWQSIITCEGTSPTDRVYPKRTVAFTFAFVLLKYYQSFSFVSCIYSFFLKILLVRRESIENKKSFYQRFFFVLWPAMNTEEFEADAKFFLNFCQRKFQSNFWRKIKSSRCSTTQISLHVMNSLFVGRRCTTLIGIALSN